MLVLGTLSFEQTKLVSNLCNDIMQLDERIAFVAMVNRHGRLVESKQRGDSPFNDLTKHESELIHMQRVLQMQMIKDFDDKISRVVLSIIKREHCTECILPFYDGILLVVFISYDDVQHITANISSLVKKFNFDITTKNVAC